jgi:hypothetical protein
MWGKIKDYWRNEFLQPEIYVDDYEEIIAFKQTEDSVILIGYLQVKSRLAPSVYHFNNFIEFIKNLGNKNYNSFTIILLCDTNLSRIKKASDILALPKDVEYYYVEYNHSLDKISFKLENLTESAKSSYRSEQLNLPWHHRKNIKIIEDSRFEDWSKWSTEGYEREWFEWYEEEKFDSLYWQFSISGIECYIDDSRLLGFYIVWKW